MASGGYSVPGACPRMEALRLIRAAIRPMAVPPSSYWPARARGEQIVAGVVRSCGMSYELQERHRIPVQGHPQPELVRDLEPFDEVARDAAELLGAVALQ